MRYFAGEEDADAAAAQLAANHRALAGVWADLDWVEAVAELDRIRHEREPTPPVEAM